MKYTALLLHPDYIAQNYGTESGIFHVEADTPAEAVTLAQADAVTYSQEHHGLEAGEGSPADFYCLLLIEGHHKDLTP